jgi:hypothetical protein
MATFDRDRLVKAQEPKSLAKGVGKYSLLVLMCFLPPTDTAYQASQPPARRSALSRFGYRLKKAITIQRAAYLPDRLYAFSRESPLTVEQYISTLLYTEIAFEAVVESIVYYRPARTKRIKVSGDAFLVCHLRHPEAPRIRISLMLDRFASNPSLTAMTTGSHARLIGEAYLECRTLKFGDPTPAPKIMDFLAIAQLVDERKSEYASAGRSGVLYGTAVYAALQEIFDGHSKDELCDDAALALFNRNSYYEKQVSAVIVAFPSARYELQSRMDRVRNVLLNYLIHVAHKTDITALVLSI